MKIATTGALMPFRVFFWCRERKTTIRIINSTRWIQTRMRKRCVHLLGKTIPFVPFFTTSYVYN